MSLCLAIIDFVCVDCMKVSMEVVQVLIIGHMCDILQFNKEINFCYRVENAGYWFLGLSKLPTRSNPTRKVCAEI